MYQPVLFDLKDIFDKPLRRYELFSSILDLTCMEKSPQVGRKPISRAALTRALIFKNLRSIATLSDLSAELYERSRLASILGFEPKEKPVPVERFSSYLKPLNKISAFGVGYFFVDGIYGHLQLAKENLAKALSLKVSEGLFDVDKAKEIVKWSFYDNPLKIFKLETK